MTNVTGTASRRDKTTEHSEDMTLWERLFKRVDWFTNKIGKFVSWWFLIIIIILLYEIFMRYFFNMPTIWVHEVTKHLFGCASVLLGGYCLLHNQHIRIDVVYRLFPARVRAAIDSFTMLFIFWWFAIYCYIGIPFAWQAWELWEVPFMPFKIPLGIVKTAIPLAGVLALIQGLVIWFRSIHRAGSGKKMP